MRCVLATLSHIVLRPSTLPRVTGDPQSTWAPSRTVPEPNPTTPSGPDVSLSSANRSPWLPPIPIRYQGQALTSRLSHSRWRPDRGHGSAVESRTTRW